MCRPEKLNCFNCEEWFNKQIGKECTRCGEFKCPHCNRCLCDMPIEVKKAVIAMIKTYENYLTENYKVKAYNFSSHNQIIK